MDTQERHAVGIALAGGGAKGLVHLGHLAAMEAVGMKPKLIAGVSAGAVIGGLYASGLSPKEIISLVKRQRYWKLFRPAYSLSGFLDMEATLRAFLVGLKPTFEELSPKLVVNANDIDRNETTYFHSGSLVQAIAASAAIPAVFAPVVIDGKRYLDGGLSNGLPVEPLLGKCQTVLGSHCNTVGYKRNRYLWSIANRSFLQAIDGFMQTKRAFCDVFLEPPGMDRYHPLRPGKADELFELGYRYASEKLEKHLAE